MCLHCNRAYTWAPAAMGNTERFMQIEVAHIGTEFSWLSQANQSIEIRAINVDLATVLMHETTYVGDGSFEHTVRRRIRNHECSKII